MKIKKAFLILLAVGTLVVGVLAGFLLGTTSGLTTIISFTDGFLGNPPGFNLSLGEFSGSVWNGIRIATLSGTLPGERLQFAAEGLEVSPGLTSIFGGRLRIVSLSCKSFMIEGVPRPGWLEGIPDIPPYGCFVGAPPVVELGEAHLDVFRWFPAASGPIELQLTGLEIGNPPSGRAPHPLRFSCAALFRNRPLFTASFTGRLGIQKAEAGGSFTARLLDQPVTGEINVGRKKSGFSASGVTNPASFDLTSIFRWLSPLWIKEFPFGFDGFLDFGGSWVFDSDLGFSGNLGGEIRKTRLVAQGLFLTIFELNSKWKLFNGKLDFEDSGSTFAGFPAKLAGSLRLQDSAPPTDLVFEVASLPMREFIQNLPWLLTRNLQLAAISGTGSLSVHLSGTPPDLLATVRLPEIDIVNLGTPAKLDGTLTWRWSFPQPPSCHVSCSWVATAAVPLVYSAVQDGRSPLITTLLPPVRFQGVFTGPSLMEGAFQGSIVSAGANYSFSSPMFNGKWTGFEVTQADGEGRPIPQGTRFQAGSDAPPLGFLLLLLGK